MYNISDYLKNGISDDEAIRACLDAAAGEPERTIVFSGREFLISRAIELPPRTTVILDGCVIRQQEETFDNVFRGDNMVVDPENPFGSPLSVKPTSGIRILGHNGAEIIGPDKHRRMWHPHFREEQDMVGDFWGWRGHQINLSQCDRFEIAGIRFTKTRSWTMSFDFCSNGFLHDIDFDTHVKNGDGIDFRVGCHHCRVSNITGYNSDDTVACTALNNRNPPPRYLFPLEPSKKFFRDGDPRKMDIHDITIENLHVSGYVHAVICLAAAGLQVYDVVIRNVSEADTTPRKCHLVDIYTGYGDGYNPGDLHDITLENITANCGISAPDAEGKVTRYAAASCRADARDIVFRNVVQNGPGEKYFLPFPDGVKIE